MSNIVAVLRDWDGNVVEDLSHHRTAFLNRFMILMTRLGDCWGWFIFGAGVIVFDTPHAQVVLVPILTGLIIDIPVYSVLKHAFSRPRPFQVRKGISCIAAPRDRFSFPSGHTSVAFVILVGAGTSYGWLFAPLAMIAVLIGISRVYLAVHYPSDVLAGCILGILCGMTGVWIS